MTPQERHYARLGRAQREEREHDAEAPGWRFPLAIAATIVLGIIIGEISTAWMTEVAGQEVQE